MRKTITLSYPPPIQGTLWRVEKIQDSDCRYRPGDLLDIRGVSELANSGEWAIEWADVEPLPRVLVHTISSGEELRVRRGHLFTRDGEEFVVTGWDATKGHVYAGRNSQFRVITGSAELQDCGMRFR